MSEEHNLRGQVWEEVSGNPEQQLEQALRLLELWNSGQHSYVASRLDSISRSSAKVAIGLICRYGNQGEDLVNFFRDQLLRGSM